MSALAESNHADRVLRALHDERRAWLRLHYGMRLSDWPRAAEIVAAERAADQALSDAMSRDEGP